MNKQLFALFLIITIGVFLRFWHLSSRPVSLSIDEVGIGYDAYSILKTGRDQWGEFLPLAFRSIGDYKPPVLEYLMVPAVGVFGLTEFGVRFTVALIGSLTIIVVYFLVKEMTTNSFISLLTAFSLAISPWHLQYSRMTHEGIVALFFVTAGTWLFLRSLRTGGKYLWLAVLFFCLSLYTYHSERLFTPLFVVALLVILVPDILKIRPVKRTLKAGLIGLIFFVPFVCLMLAPQGKTRAVNAFLSQDVELNSQLHKSGEKLSFGSKIFDSNQLQILNFWSKRYLGYFDLPYLFFKGMKLAINQAPGVGLFYLAELPFFLIGLWQVFIKKKFFSRKMFILFTAWLLLGPIAASIANNEQHPARSLTFIPTMQLLVGIGGFVLYKTIKNFSKIKVYIISAFLIVAFGTSLIYYLDLYHFHYPINFSEYWSYGMKEAALFAWKHQGEYEKIVIDSSFGSIGPFTVTTPHLYVYFYGQYDPHHLQTDPLHGQGANRDSSDFSNFVFRPIYWPEDRFAKNTLFIGSPWSLPPDELANAKLLKKINFLNGSTALFIISTK